MIRTIFPTCPATTAFLAFEKRLATLQAVAAHGLTARAVGWGCIAIARQGRLVVQVDGYGDRCCSREGRRGEVDGIE